MAGYSPIEGFGSLVEAHPILILLIIVDLILRGFALWKSARNNQLFWFVAALILNTAGILPLIYLIFFQKKTKK